MRKNIIIIFFLFLSTSIFAEDFVQKFKTTCIESKRPMNNVSIGKSMLEKMAKQTKDKELKEILSDLHCIRIITTENKRDSKYYFKKAKQLVQDEFSNSEEVTSLDEENSKVIVLLDKSEDKEQENKMLTLIALENNKKLTIISVSGNIDFESFTKLSKSLNESLPTENEEKGIEETK